MRAALGVVVLVLGTGAGACERKPGPPVTVIDLVKLSDRAEKRPAGARFEIAERPCGGGRLAGFSVPVPSRVIYRLNFPRSARLVTTPVLDGSPGASVEFRIGISDRRTYETLATQIVAADDCAAGTVMTVDLSRYAGWQWSLFYRPDARAWELIFGVSGRSGEIRGALWGLPRIEAGTREARAFRER